jgi:cytochrome c-type biogenesis protein CcmH
MPLVIQRHQVKDLPLKFTLDDSQAMQGAQKLSALGQLVVVARVSRSGQAAAQPGDLTGQSAPVAPGAQGLRVEIGEVFGKP